MKKTKYLIIGAGITGLTFANYVDDYLIVEKDEKIGGYCKTIKKNGFVFDYAGHFFHFKTDEWKKFFLDNVKNSELVKKNKCTKIYYKDKLIDYPFQMNIHQLEKQDFINCLYDLFNKEEKEKYSNFLEMLYGKFGKSITEMFLKPYNEKLYAVDLKKLDTNAMGRFFPYADKEQIIKNMKEENANSYNNTFLYPKEGAEFFIEILEKKLNSEKILLNTTIEKINLKEKYVIVNNDEKIYFEYLINTIPFNNFLKLTEEKEYIELSKKLSYNKVLVLNLGFNKKSKYTQEHWIYVPEKEYNYYRVGFYNNILGQDKLSLYIEIGLSKDDKVNVDLELKKTLENLKVQHIIDKDMKLEESEIILMNPAYVHIEDKTNKQIDNVMKKMNENNIYSIGRYGAWTYCSMEDCMISAKELASKLMKGK